MKERGLTLLEILVSMGVLVFGILALLNLNIATIRVNASGSDLPTAIMLADDLINQMRTWMENDIRIIDSNPGNNEEPDFTNFDPYNPYAEHSEDELEIGYNGIVPCAPNFRGILCSPDGTTPYFRRFWNVANLYDTNNNLIPDIKKIVVFVVFTTASGMIGSTTVVAIVPLLPQ